MTQEEILDFKELLIKERNEILKELVEDESILNNSMDYVGDSAEYAFDNLDKELVSKISFQQKETLKKIEKALKKLEEETYGKCEKCESEISVERLNILPYTTICKACIDK
ncbi:MAG: hypothetical protein A2Y41_04370 [Spirochaetes bacterium GWB1_36_13]|nr:MAG: hypothetical protein A2Y41_04370 [Spirochaetes bacterium GWB1_36_13]